MSFDNQTIDIAIDRYQEFVRKGKRHALQITDTRPQPAACGRLYQQATNWLGAQLMSLGRSLRHAEMATAPGEHPAR